MPIQNKYIIESPKILLYSAIGGIVMTAFTCGECLYSARIYAYVAAFTTLIWFVMWMGNGMLVNYIGCRISWVEEPVKRLVVGVVSTLVYSIAAVSVLVAAFEYLLHFNFGNFLVIIGYTVALTFTISLILHSREFLRNWRLSALNAEKFEKESIRAQYDSLRNQVSPHFLFNSLNALTHLVYEDQEKAVRFIKQLSDVYRYLLDTREMEVVSLESELKFLHSYLYLLEIRFAGNLKVDFQLGPVSGSVAPLALQLLVENAVKHNIISRDQPLDIKLYERDGFIVVENKLQKKLTPEENLSGLGLENIRKRYSFLTDRQVEVEETADRFIVQLPLLTLPGV